MKNRKVITYGDLIKILKTFPKDLLLSIGQENDERSTVIDFHDGHFIRDEKIYTQVKQ